MLPYSRLFDQRTLALMVDHDAIVQRYRSLFALIEWQVLPDPVPDPSRPGKRPHPESAYIKALLIKIWVRIGKRSGYPDVPGGYG